MFQLPFLALFLCASNLSNIAFAENSEQDADTAKPADTLTDISGLFSNLTSCTQSCLSQIPGFSLPPTPCQVKTALCDPDGEAANVLTTCIPSTNCFDNIKCIMKMPKLCENVLMDKSIQCDGNESSTLDSVTNIVKRMEARFATMPAPR